MYTTSRVQHDNLPIVGTGRVFVLEEEELDVATAAESAVLDVCALGAGCSVSRDTTTIRFFSLCFEVA